MVLLDCATNIATIGVMVLSFPVRVWENPYLCIIFTFYRMFVILVNRFVVRRHHTNIVSCLSSSLE